MSLHLMLDFETLGTNPDTAVLSLGAVLFDEERIREGRYWVFDIEDQMRYRRTITFSTLCWWLRQSKGAQQVFSECEMKGVKLAEFAKEFREFVAGQEVSVWGNGATFDVSIIEHIFRTGNSSPPWRYGNVRCYRTLKKIEGFTEGPREGVHHNALDDAVFQANNVIQYFKRKVGK